MTKIYTLRSIVLGVLLIFASTAIINNANAQSLPKPDHIVFIIEENLPNVDIIGDPTVAPYINQLSQDSNAVIFNQFYAIEHPSQPNYLDLFSGGNQGVLDDNLPANYPFISPNLGYELLNKGYTFTTYSQDLPSVGSDVENSTIGSYARKHNPVTNWVGTGPNQVPDTLNQPFTNLPTDFSKLPTVSFIVPDEDSDMHNGTYPTCATIGDYWMKTYLSNLINWAAVNNTLVIYTFDEDDGFYNNNIPTVFIGPMVQPGTCSTNYTLYSLLRTIEDMYSLGEHAGAAAQASDITGVWKGSALGIKNVTNTAQLKVSPDPVSTILTLDASSLTDAGGQVEITDVTGRVISQNTMPASKILQLNTTEYPAGVYFYRLTQANAAFQTGKFVVAHQ